MNLRIGFLDLTAIFGLAFVAANIAAMNSNAADWTQFRGGESLSVASETSLGGLASGQGSEVWRREIPGSGWAQPVVIGNKVFATTAVEPEAKRPKGMRAGAMDLSTMGKGPEPKNELEWRLLCLDASTGAIIWDKLLIKAKPQFGVHASNTFATETPAASKSAIYSFVGPLGVVVAMDLEGNELWRKDLGAQKIQNQFGTGSSPLLVGDSLVIQQYSEEFARMVCLNVNDGSQRWRVDREKGTSWSTPIAWKNGDVTEVIGAGQGMVIAYDLTSGKEKWRLGGLDTSFSCSVVADAQGLYFGTSSPGSSAPIFAVRPGKSGDLTLATEQATSDAVMWSKTKSGAGMPSPVIVGDLLFFFGNTAVCYDKLSGEELFRKRMPQGTLVAGCPIVIGNNIFVINESGTLLTIPVGKEFTVAGEMQIGPKEEVYWSTPAATADSLIIRSSDAVYAVR
jgi:outer membrane protein assembly factor BamB